MTRLATTPPKFGAEGRCRIGVSLSLPESQEVARAAEGQTVAEFARWAVLHMARAVNAGSAT